MIFRDVGCAMMLLALPAMAKPVNVQALSAASHSYVPISRNTDFLLGTMRLGPTFASFTKLKGHLDLVLKGEMAGPEDFGVGKMKMYRVTNAEEFWARNKGKNGFCTRPVEWVGVTPMSSEQVRISFFEMGGPKGLLDEGVGFLADEKGGLGLCSADSFAPKNGNW